MKLVEQRHINGGRQRLYRFDNERGASVVNHRFSYGHASGKWELAVLRFKPDVAGLEDFELDYGTELTHDVIGHLDWEEVEDLLQQIEALPTPVPCEPFQSSWSWGDDMKEAN